VKRTSDTIQVIAHHRVNKSVLGNRTTKNGQHLRKIAEGLGELNLSRFTYDTDHFHVGTTKNQVKRHNTSLSPNSRESKPPLNIIIGSL
jgi:hypothetical protein